jgi:hypothetical protein
MLSLVCVVRLRRFLSNRVPHSPNASRRPVVCYFVCGMARGSPLVPRFCFDPCVGVGLAPRCVVNTCSYCYLLGVSSVAGCPRRARDLNGTLAMITLAWASLMGHRCWPPLIPLSAAPRRARLLCVVEVLQSNPSQAPWCCTFGAHGSCSPFAALFR